MQKSGVFCSVQLPFLCSDCSHLGFISKSTFPTSNCRHCHLRLLIGHEKNNPRTEPEIRDAIGRSTHVTRRSHPIGGTGLASSAWHGGGRGDAPETTRSPLWSNARQCQARPKSFIRATNSAKRRRIGGITASRGSRRQMNAPTTSGSQRQATEPTAAE